MGPTPSSTRRAYRFESRGVPNLNRSVGRTGNYLGAVWAEFDIADDFSVLNCWADRLPRLQVPQTGGTVGASNEELCTIVAEMHAPRSSAGAELSYQLVVTIEHGDGAALLVTDEDEPGIFR